MYQMNKSNWFYAKFASNCNKSAQILSTSKCLLQNMDAYCIPTTICSSKWSKNWQQWFVTWAQQHTIAQPVTVNNPLMPTIHQMIDVFHLSNIYWYAKLTCAESSFRYFTFYSRAFRVWKQSHCMNNLCHLYRSPNYIINRKLLAMLNIWWIQFIFRSSSSIISIIPLIFRGK